MFPGFSKSFRAFFLEKNLLFFPLSKSAFSCLISKNKKDPGLLFIIFIFPTEN